jgi:hypothetical protein
MFYFTKYADNNLVYEITFGEKCQYCRKKISGNKGRFESTPAWLYFDFNYRTNIDSVNHTHVPKMISVGDLNYKLLYCQIKDGDHFRGIFLIHDNFYMIDDLKRGEIFSIPESNKVSNCLYHLV